MENGFGWEWINDRNKLTGFTLQKYTGLASLIFYTSSTASRDKKKALLYYSIRRREGRYRGQSIMYQITIRLPEGLPVGLP